jgi:hypothetical protein
VFAPADGYCTVHADYASTASSALGLDGDTALPLASTSGSLTDKALKLYLSSGDNRITAAGPSGGSLTLRDLRVTSGIDATGATTCQAEAATQAGAAAVANDTWASGGTYVGSIGNGLGQRPHLPGERPCGRALRDETCATPTTRSPGPATATFSTSSASAPDIDKVTAAPLSG